MLLETNSRGGDTEPERSEGEGASPYPGIFEEGRNEGGEIPCLLGAFRRYLPLSKAFRRRKSCKACFDRIFDEEMPSYRDRV